jgi:hypothetical protein
VNFNDVYKVNWARPGLAATTTKSVSPTVPVFRNIKLNSLFIFGTLAALDWLTRHNISSDAKEDLDQG